MKQGLYIGKFEKASVRRIRPEAVEDENIMEENLSATPTYRFPDNKLAFPTKDMNSVGKKSGDFYLNNPSAFRILSGLPTSRNW